MFRSLDRFAHQDSVLGAAGHQVIRFPQLHRGGGRGSTFIPCGFCWQAAEKAIDMGATGGFETVLKGRFSVPERFFTNQHSARLSGCS